MEIVLIDLLESIEIAGTVLFGKWLTAVKHMLRLSVRKKGI
jgi:hypothetical protein